MPYLKAFLPYLLGTKLMKNLRIYMQAIEFETKAKDGMIKIPKKYLAEV